MTVRASARAAGAAFVAAAILFTGCGPEGGDSDAPSPARRPNVVVVITDDQDVASLAVMPRVQELIGAPGTEFSRSYATTPECCPSRATLLTGQYAHNHGVLSSSPPEGGYGALDGSETLPVWLQRAGYRTAFVGKYLNDYGNPGNGNDPTEIPPGWDDWTALTNGTEHEMYGYDLNDDGELVRYGERPRDYLTDVLSGFAVEAIGEASARERPFMLIAAPLAPHGEGSLEGTRTSRDPRPAPRHLGAFDGALPIKVPDVTVDPTGLPRALQPRVRKTLRRIDSGEREAVVRGRLESLLAVDEMIGALVDELERTGELERTVLVFTSDNGFLLGEHGLLGKELPYEESARVPLLVRGPGFPAGTVSDELVANIDIAPTIAELAGAQPGLDPDGTSLLGAARGEGDPDREILIEYPVGPRRYRAIRSGEHLFARFDEGGELLFDLAADPAELDNLADDPGLRELRVGLAERLDRLADCAGTSCR